MTKRFVMLVTAAVALGAGACATLGRQAFREPVVTFRDIQVEGLGLTGGTLDVILSVYNPNGYRLDATRVRYNLLVGDTPLGGGVLDSRFTVRAGDSTIVKLPVTLDYKGLSAAGKELMAKGSVDYRVRGDVTVATGAGSFTVPYDRTGRFSNISGTRH